MAKTVVGSFDSFDEARRVVDELERSGFSRSDISIVGNNADRRYDTTGSATAAADDAGSGAGAGAVAGGLVGGAAGLIAGLMGLTIPGIGPIIAAGPIAATLGGAGVGAVAGGILGALTRVGVSDEDAHYYAESLRRGGALVTMKVDDTRADEAAAIMRRFGAVDIERRAEEWRRSGWTRYEERAPVYTGEQVQREREQWRESDWRRFDDEFRRDHATVMSGTSRSAAAATAPMAGAASAAASSAPGTKRAPPPSYSGSTAPVSTGAGSIPDSISSDYDSYSPAYRYGYDLAREGRYRGRNWDDIESDLRTDWSSRYPDRHWDSIRHAVRRGWERTSDALERAMPGDSDRDGK